MSTRGCCEGSAILGAHCLAGGDPWPPCPTAAGPPTLGSLGAPIGPDTSPRRLPTAAVPLPTLFPRSLPERGKKLPSAALQFVVFALFLFPP